MKTICAITNNPCREIVEGIRQVGTLRTEPYVPVVLQPRAVAKAPALLMRIDAPESRTAESDGRNRTLVGEMFKKFKASRRLIEGGDIFKSSDVVTFAKAEKIGWGMGAGPNTNQLLLRESARGEVVKISRGTWKFKEAA